MSIKRLILSIGGFLALVVCMQFFVAARPAAAQAATVPDFTQFGYSQVGGTVTFTPGQSATVTAGNQQVVLPADFISKTVKFELLLGDPGFFAPLLKGDDAGRPVVAAFAFRVTDPATNNLIGRFDKPVQWSITDPSIGSGSEVYNTSAANPPAITANSAPGTVQGTTLSHPFAGAGVGWLVLNPAAAPEPTAAATPAPVISPVTPATPPGMPTTGNPAQDAGVITALAALAGLLCLLGVVALRREKFSRK